MAERFHGKAMFVALPRSYRKPVEHGCACSFCKSHPEHKPMWDVLGIEVANPNSTWVVHYPEVSYASDYNQVLPCDQQVCQQNFGSLPGKDAVGRLGRQR